MKKILAITSLALVVIVGLSAETRTTDAAGAANFFRNDGNTLAIFEFNGNVQDVSGNGRHATLLNPDASYIASTYGQGLLLPNEEDVFQGIDWSDHKALLTPPYTVETIIYPEEFNSWNRLFTHDPDDDNGLYYDDGSLVNYPDSPLAGVSLPAQTRHCLAWSAPLSPANKLNLYLDGQFLGQVNRTYNVPSVAWFFMDDIDGVPNENIYGHVDAMRISNVARSDEELAATCQASNDGTVLADADDNDGITKEIEDAAPNSGDGNNDGVLDSEQAYVTSYKNGMNQDVTIEFDDDCEISEAGSLNEDGNTVKDPGYTYNYGFLSFTARCGDPGFTATAKLFHYDTVQTSYTVRKYNPTTNAYFTVDGARTSQEMIGDRVVTVATYEITDGGILDIDADENGIIVDPVGLGVIQSSSPNTGVLPIRDFLFKRL